MVANKVFLYPGSFDPITLGHLDILRQALNIADKVVIAIGTHSEKTALFSFAERKSLIEVAIQADFANDLLKRIEITEYNNLTIVAAKDYGASTIIRGLRDGTDLDYEMQLAGMNAAMAPEIETVFFPARALLRSITATLVRQIAALDGEVSSFVPANVVTALKKKFS